MTTEQKRRTTGAIARLLGTGALLAIIALAAPNWNDARTLDLHPAPAAPGQAQADQLINEHGCWRGEAPADVTISGHVVLLEDGQARYAGPVATGWALEHMTDPRVQAFCR